MATIPLRTASAPRSVEEIREETGLVMRAREGDEGAFRELFHRYAGRVYSVACGILHDATLSQDVLQEVFIRVFRSIDRFDSGRNFYTWLYQITINLSIDFLRRKARQKATAIEELGESAGADPTPEPTVAASREETSLRVRQVLDMLPLKYRVVLALRDLEGFSCEEISELMQCKNATVRWRIHQARKIFRRLWEGEEAGSQKGWGDDDEL